MLLRAVEYAKPGSVAEALAILREAFEIGIRGVRLRLEVEQVEGAARC